MKRWVHSSSFPISHEIKISSMFYQEPERFINNTGSVSNKQDSGKQKKQKNPLKRLHLKIIGCIFFSIQCMYRVAQKQWIKFSIEKSLVIFSVIFFGILHASTYDIHNYIYKVQKSAAASARPPAAAACGRLDSHWSALLYFCRLEGRKKAYFA